MPGQPLQRLVQWVPSYSCRGTSFKVECTSGSAPQQSAAAPGDATSVVVSGLTPEATYTCSVVAVGPLGTGQFSAASAPFTTAASLEVAKYPTNGDSAWCAALGTAA